MGYGSSTCWDSDPKNRGPFNPFCQQGYPHTELTRPPETKSNRHNFLSVQLFPEGLSEDVSQVFIGFDHFRVGFFTSASSRRLSVRLLALGFDFHALRPCHLPEGTPPRTKLLDSRGLWSRSCNNHTNGCPDRIGMLIEPGSPRCVRFFFFSQTQNSPDTPSELLGRSDSQRAI